MCVGEAALYGDLVRHLRDAWVHDVCALTAESPDAERRRLDDVIRAWFFTPQDGELAGCTPRDYIRSEQLIGHGPMVPIQRLPVELRQEAREQEVWGEPIAENGVALRYAPSSTLLDDFDPDGAQELHDALLSCPICDAMAAWEVEHEGQLEGGIWPAEASSWLAGDGPHGRFAPTRFEGRDQARAFVDQLYRLGAESVEVDLWFGSAEPDALIASLPDDRRAATDLYTLWIAEMVLRQGLDPSAFLGYNELIFVWPENAGALGEG